MSGPTGGAAVRRWITFCSTSLVDRDERTWRTIQLPEFIAAGIDVRFACEVLPHHNVAE